MKIFAAALGLILGGIANQAMAACNAISPNPNPAGNTITNSSATGCYQGPFNNLGTLNNEGTLAENVGVLNNGGTLNNSGTLDHRGLNNDGVLNNSGQLYTSSPGNSVHNGLSGTMNNSGQLTNFGAALNEGTLNNSGKLFNPADVIDNKGVLVNSGTIQSTGSITNSGKFLNYGTVTNGGTNNGFYSQTGGTTLVDGSLTQLRITVSGGILQGNGTVNGLSRGGPGISIDGGTVNSGGLGHSAGTLTMTGKFNFNSGVLATDIAGTGAGQFDLLRLTDQASFAAGSLQFSFLNGYLPDVGDKWLFLTAAGGITGWETLSRAFLGVPDNYLFDITAANGGLVLEVAAVPEPETWALMAVGLALVAFRVQRNKSSISSSRLDVSLSHG
ncbi:MAG TPA: PEP-CTERM sorting domain-containing protein [Burkholderiales bacterium]|nr:PEP-CTERM sorting domain-containing protein [Burkholderiales bacterium]